MLFLVCRLIISSFLIKKQPAFSCTLRWPLPAFLPTYLPACLGHTFCIWLPPVWLSGCACLTSFPAYLLEFASVYMQKTQPLSWCTSLKVEFFAYALYASASRTWLLFWHKPWFPAFSCFLCRYFIGVCSAYNFRTLCSHIVNYVIVHL